MTMNNLPGILGKLFSVNLRMWRHFFSNKTDGKQMILTLNLTLKFIKEHEPISNNILSRSFSLDISFDVL